jgi:hypothetical protein
MLASWSQGRFRILEISSIWQMFGSSFILPMKATRPNWYQEHWLIVENTFEDILLALPKWIHFQTHIQSINSSIIVYRFYRFYSIAGTISFSWQSKSAPISIKGCSTFCTHFPTRQDRVWVLLLQLPTMQDRVGNVPPMPQQICNN